MKYSTNMVEKWLEDVSVAGVRILCKVDRIDITQDKIVLIDYKTGNVDKLLKHPYDFQLTFYYLWAKQNYPNKQIEAIYWDIAQSKKVKTAYKVDQLIEALSDLPTKTTMAQDILWDDKIVKKWTNICKYCDYRIACGRDV
jgi:RecB family exonuclease